MENMAQKTVAELKAKIAELKAELLQKRLQHAKNNLKDTASIAKMKRDLARALTALSMKEAESRSSATTKGEKGGGK